MSIVSILENPKFTTFASGAAGAVYATTAIKAGVRPAVIYGDKHSDKSTKKYTASKEFIYQCLCLGVALSIVPLFKKGGFKLLKKHLADLKDSNKDVQKMKDSFKTSLADKIAKATDSKKSKLLKKIETLKSTKVEDLNLESFENMYKGMKTSANIDQKTISIMHKVHGGGILGEFIGSIFGLTIIAPLLSMIVLHPILKAVGVEKDKK